MASCLLEPNFLSILRGGEINSKGLYLYSLGIFQSLTSVYFLKTSVFPFLFYSEKSLFPPKEQQNTLKRSIFSVFSDLYAVLLLFWSFCKATLLPFYCKKKNKLCHIQTFTRFKKNIKFSDEKN